MRRLSSLECFDEIGNLMNEGMLVTDLQSWHPPFFHVGMLATVIGDVNRSPAAEFAFIAVIKPFESMEIVEVPADRSILAIDFKGVEGLVSAGVSGRFEKTH